MQKGDISGALRLLTNNINNAIIPLNEDTLLLLEQKHPEGKPVVESGTIINGPLERIHAIAFNEINEDIILKAASSTKKAASSTISMAGFGLIKTPKKECIIFLD